MGIDNLVPDIKQWNSSRNEGRWGPHQGTDVAAIAQLGTVAGLGAEARPGGRNHTEQQPNRLQEGTCSEQLQFHRSFGGGLRHDGTAESEPHRLGEAALGGLHLSQLTGQPDFPASHDIFPDGDACHSRDQGQSDA
jgi:hypothetical protein